MTPTTDEIKRAADDAVSTADEVFPLDQLEATDPKERSDAEARYQQILSEELGAQSERLAPLSDRDTRRRIIDLMRRALTIK